MPFNRPFILIVLLLSWGQLSIAATQKSTLNKIEKPKKLKKQNQELMNQTSTLQSKVDKLTKDNTTLEKKNKESSMELNKVKTYYGAYKDKLTKMKTELVAAFPNNLSEANFSVREEDGRLIITVPNKILYPRGSADFSPAALEVIQKLSQVFKNNQNLQILIEGHTDNIPLKKGGRYKDNWDLSVARAVNIVRQFEAYGVHPKRLTAAGRSYFSPANNIVSEEARDMNRRTEIIIRPKITELLKMMNEIEKNTKT